MPQNEQKPDKSNLRCKKDELQQITRQNDKMKMQDEKTMIYVKKPHETRCSDSHIISKKDEKTVFATSLGRLRET